MREFIREFLELLRVERGLAKNSILSYKRDLKKYHLFIEKRQRLDDITKVTQRNLRAYIRYLNAEKISANSIKRAISSIRTYHSVFNSIFLSI